MKKAVFIALAVFSFLQGRSQFTKANIEATDKLIKDESGIPGKPLQGTFIGFSNPPSDDLTWQPTLYKVSENKSEDDELLHQIKEQKNKLKENYQATSGARTTTTATPPVIGANFAGLNNNGIYTPLDNTLAISDKDTIVAFINTKLGYYTTTGTFLYSHDVYAMLGDNTITNNLCDPKVIWDNVARRFIFYVQVCDGLSANSLVVLGFSKSSNPMDGWYHYKFTGNPLNNNCFWDYPKMAVSTDEVFVTGNLFGNNSGPYNTSVIYQIQKAPCFAGSTSTTSKYYTTTHFTPLPVGYGQKGSYGPGIYLVSTGGTTPGTTNIKLMDITNNIASGTAVLNSYNVPTTTFSNAGDANQLGSSLKLDVLDCRAMDGFYLKGTVHFVFSKDIGGGFTGTSYNRLSVSSLTNVDASFGNATGAAPTDITFPALASEGIDSNDKSVIITFNESGSAIYPRTCVVRCDNNMNWSAPVVVKSGLSFIDYGTTATYERWGDYNGMAKRYGDSSGTMWMAGMYGGASNYWLQWIAQIRPFALGVTTANTPPQTSAQVFPNPIVDFYKVKFDVPERQNIVINITDMEGRTVVELYRGIAEQGENLFSFNKAGMANGTYSLNIIGSTTNIRNEKIVVTGK